MGAAAGFLLVGAALIGAAVAAGKLGGSASSAQQAVTTQLSGGASSPPAASGATYGQIPFSYVQAIGQAKGWTPSQIQDWWQHLIPSESDGTLTDTNPTTRAYGIAQGITGPGWYAQHGGDATTVWGQLTGMANYIGDRYGDPTAAWVFHQGHNWY